MGCNICKPCLKQNPKKKITTKRYQRAKTPIKPEQHTAPHKISLRNLRSMFSQQNIGLNTNEGNSRIIVKKITYEKSIIEKNENLKNSEKKFIADFREFKRNGINSQLNFDKEIKRKNQRQSFLKIMMLSYTIR